MDFLYIDLRWIIVIFSAGMSFAVLSPMIAARKLYYFASSLPHAALFAAVVGYPLAVVFGGDPAIWAIVVGVPLSYIVIYLVQRGVEEDVATAVFVSFAVSASVAAIYFVLTHYAVQTSLWSYILGDPLLASWGDTYFGLVIMAVSLALTLPFYREHVLIGFDRDFAEVSGIKTRLYDYMVVTALTIAAVGFLKIVGFVVEHVMLLLPASLALNLSKTSFQALYISVLASLSASLVGLFLSILVDAAPSAVIGFILLLGYIVSLIAGGKR